MIKLCLIFGCWSVLLVSLLAADGVSNQSGLSTTATESYQIRNKKFGDLLRPENASGAEGARIVLYPAEPWKCMTWKLQPVGDAIFRVQNHFTAKTFIVKSGDGDKAVVQAKLLPEKSEQSLWRFVKLADGAYEICDAKSGTALTAVEVAGGSARIVAALWSGTDNQKWSLEKIDPATLTM
ncbi:MAG TPA: RICIN domain-containing protein [Verrucomicrobiae bacterium]